MSIQFRKSKTSGPFRVTASKRGVSTSVGIGPIRYSLGADGKTRRTIRVPGTGIYQTEVIDDGKGIDIDQAEMESIRAPRKRRPWQVWFLAAALAFLVFVILVL